METAPFAGPFSTSVLIHLSLGFNDFCKLEKNISWVIHDDFKILF